MKKLFLLVLFALCANVGVVFAQSNATSTDLQLKDAVKVEKAVLKADTKADAKPACAKSAKACSKSAAKGAACCKSGKKNIKSASLNKTTDGATLKLANGTTKGASAKPACCKGKTAGKTCGSKAKLAGKDAQKLKLAKEQDMKQITPAVKVIQTSGSEE